MDGPETTAGCDRTHSPTERNDLEGVRFVGLLCLTSTTSAPAAFGYELPVWNDGSMQLISQEVPRTATPDPIASNPGSGTFDLLDLEMLSIQCVRTSDGTTVTGLVDGAVVIEASVTESRPLRPFTHVGISGGGGAEPWQFEVDEITASVPSVEP